MLVQPWTDDPSQKQSQRLEREKKRFDHLIMFLAQIPTNKKMKENDFIANVVSCFLRLYVRVG